MNEKKITCDPDVMMGKPVIEGTRITVELILEKLGAGETIDQIVEQHPRLTRDHVQTAVRYATGAVNAEVTYPVSPEVA